MGMSNERMTIPDGITAEYARTELLFYLSFDAVNRAPDLIHFCSDVLLHYAKYPFVTDTFLGSGNLEPVCVIGPGQVRFHRDDSIGGLLFHPTPDSLPEFDLPKRLQLAGDPVRFLMLVPLTHQETSFARMAGVGNLLEQCPDIPGIYAGPRASRI